MSLPRFLRRALASEAVWRASGFTLATAIRATRGRFQSVSAYLEDCRRELAPLDAWIPSGGSVIEFGCGPGGLLLALRTRIGRGIGVDINRGYIRHARRLALRLGAPNLEFVAYDGRRLPPMDAPVDLVLSMGVFERVPLELGRAYLAALRPAVRPGGHFVIYFLSERALGTPLTALLGDDAYAPWPAGVPRAALEGCGLTVVAEIPSGRIEGRPGQGPVDAGDVLIARAPG